MKLSFWPATRPAWRLEPVLAESELELEQRAVVVLFLTERDVAAGRVVVERLLPVDGVELLAHLLRGHARGVHPADDRAHAGADDEVDGDPQLLHHLDHTDMGRTAGAAPGEHQPDAFAIVGAGPGECRGAEEQRHDDGGNRAAHPPLRACSPGREQSSVILGRSIQGQRENRGALGRILGQLGQKKGL